MESIANMIRNRNIMHWRRCTETRWYGYFFAEISEKKNAAGRGSSKSRREVSILGWEADDVAFQKACWQHQCHSTLDQTQIAPRLESSEIACAGDSVCGFKPAEWRRTAFHVEIFECFQHCGQTRIIARHRCLFLWMIKFKQKSTNNDQILVC